MKATPLLTLVASTVPLACAACSTPSDSTSNTDCTYADGYYDCPDAGWAEPPDAGSEPTGVDEAGTPDAGAPDTQAPEAGPDAGPPTPVCEAGSIQTVAAGQSDPGIMAVDGKGTYWFDFSPPGATPTATLMMAPIDGGAPAALASVSGAPRSMTVSAGQLYWTDLYSGTVMAMPTEGGPPVTLASGQNEPVGIAADATSVYWTTWAGGAVLKVPIGGGAPVVFADGQGEPGALASDATNLYWGNASGEVMQAPIAGGLPVVLARLQSAVDVAVDASRVYWANDPGGSGAGTVTSVPIGGGELATIASGLTDPEYIVVDGATIYVTQDGEVATIPVGGGPVTPISRSSTCTPQDPFAIVTDSASVFWTNTLSGTVLKMSK